MIPHYTKYSIDEYVNNKIPIGGFLHSVLSNDLFTAVTKADEANLRCLKDIVLYIYNHTPSACWGSPEIVKEWLETR